VVGDRDLRVLAANAQLNCVFEATTDAPTLINMAQHSYFNLAGHNSGTILGHNLLIKGCALLTGTQCIAGLTVDVSVRTCSDTVLAAAMLLAVHCVKEMTGG